MEWKEIASGAVLVGALAVLAGFYAWRQVRMLRRLRGPHGLSDEEVRWRRGQAWRRLVGSALMLAMAGLLTCGALVMGDRAMRLNPSAPEDQQFLRVYVGVWFAFFLLLFLLILLAAADIWSTRRFSVRQQRKILDDKKEMILREVVKDRQQRNGHG